MELRFSGNSAGLRYGVKNYKLYAVVEYGIYVVMAANYETGVLAGGLVTRPKRLFLYMIEYVFVILQYHH